MTSNVERVAQYEAHWQKHPDLGYVCDECERLKAEVEGKVNDA